MRDAVLAGQEGLARRKETLDARLSRWLHEGGSLTSGRKPTLPVPLQPTLAASHPNQPAKPSWELGQSQAPDEMADRHLPETLSPLTSQGSGHHTNPLHHVQHIREAQRGAVPTQMVAKLCTAVRRHVVSGGGDHLFPVLNRWHFMI